LLHRRRRHILDVRFAAVDGVHLARVQVDAGDAVAGISKGHRQRQPDIAQPDDGDVRVATGKFASIGFLFVLPEHGAVR
jgi:hypothetical protein